MLITAVDVQWLRWWESTVICIRFQIVYSYQTKLKFLLSFYLSTPFGSFFFFSGTFLFTE